jgi:hypothetical protein
MIFCNFLVRGGRIGIWMVSQSSGRHRPDPANRFALAPYTHARSIDHETGVSTVRPAACPAPPARGEMPTPRPQLASFWPSHFRCLFLREPHHPSRARLPPANEHDGDPSARARLAYLFNVEFLFRKTRVATSICPFSLHD